MSQDYIDEYIKNHYENTTVTKLSKELNVSRGTVTRRAKKMGLSKERDFREEKEEVVKTISDPALEGFYSVTNKGRVFNNRTKKILTPKIDNHGYPKITFQIKKIRVERRVHRLVAIEFIDNPNNKPFINHIDGDKTNYDIHNLEWVSPKENATHASRFGLLINNSGENSPFARLKEKEVLEIKKLLAEGHSQAEIVRLKEFATRSTVQKISSGARWKHV